MTNPIQAATVAAINSDRRSWKAHNFKEGETESRRFTRACRAVANAKARNIKDLQCKARLVLLVSEDDRSMEASLARDVLALTGVRA